MKTKRIMAGVMTGTAVFVVGIWVLSKTLGNDQPAWYHGLPLNDWVAQVTAKDAAASNQANAILNAEIIPQLTDKMFHDTNDLWIRTSLVDALNGLPGIFIQYNTASMRRNEAAIDLGAFGPPARAAIPALLRAVQSSDPTVREGAVTSLGKIHSEPEVVIPFLTKYLDDDDLNDEAATALAEFGSLARPAVPKIIPLLHAADDDAQAAAAAALQKIDPVAYTNALNETSKK